MRVLKILLPLVVVAVGVATFVGFKATAPAPEPLRPQNRAPVVAVQVVEKITASPTLGILGQVETPAVSVLTAAVEADVLTVQVLEGDAVARGAEMIGLDDTDTVLQILQRQAELAEIEALMESDRIQFEADESALETEQSLLALAHKAVARAERLARLEVGSEAALDQALRDEQNQRLAVTRRLQSIDDFPSRQLQLQARHDRAAAALRQAERARERTRITAPFSGRIVDVMVSPGDRVSPGTQLIQLYDESQLELRVQVPSGHVAALRQALDGGGQVRATVGNGGDGAPVELVLHRLSANVVAGQGGIDAFFRAHRGNLPVLGDTVAVQLELPPIENVVVLSPDSLYGRERVYQVEDGVLQSRAVRRLGQIGDPRGRQMVIVSGDGFQSGDRILSSRLPQAVNGLKVRIAP